MGSKMDAVGRGVSITAKIIVSVIWLVGGIACFATGVWWAGLIAIAYLLYLWVFGGRWLIY